MINNFETKVILKLFKVYKYFFLFFFASSFLIFFGISKSKIFDRNLDILVLTDNKQVAIYINEFNFIFKTNIRIKYRDFISENIINQVPHNILISSNFDKVNLKFYKKIPKHYYNPDYKIFNSIAEELGKVIPIGFDLSILVYLNNPKKPIKKLLKISDLISLYEQYKTENKFFISPFISNELIYYLSILNLKLPVGDIKKNFCQLPMVFNHTDELFKLINKDLEAHKIFFRKYGYLPLNKILFFPKNKLIAGMIKLSTYYKYIHESNNLLNFSYIVDDEGKIPVNSLIFLSTKQLDRNSEKFIRWFVSYENHYKLIHNKPSNKNILGLLDSLTPYKAINLVELEKITKNLLLLIDESKINIQTQFLLDSTFKKTLKNCSAKLINNEESKTDNTDID